MVKLYVIVDKAMKVDTFCFVQNTDGAAGSYFYNWCLMQNHRNFALYSIGSLGYSDGQYVYEDIDRKHLVDMPEEVD